MNEPANYELQVYKILHLKYKLRKWQETCSHSLYLSLSPITMHKNTIRKTSRHLKDMISYYFIGR